MAIVALSSVEYRVTEKFKDLIESMDPHNDPENAIMIAEKALEFAQKKKETEYLALAYDRLGFAYSFGNNLNLALQYQARAIQLFEQLGDTEGMARVLQNQGHVYEDIGNSVESYRVTIQALKIARSTAPFELARALLNSAHITYTLGLTDLAMEYLHEAIISAQRADKPATLARAYSMLGGIQFELGQHAHGIELVEQSITIGKSIPKKYGLLQSQLRLCFIYAAAGQEELALQIGETVLLGFSEMGARRDTIEIALLLANICVKRENLLLAHKYFEIASSFREDAIEANVEIELLRCRAFILESEGNFEDSIQILLEALEISKNFKSPLLLMATEKSLYELYHRTGDNLLAFQHLKNVAAAEKQHLEQLHASKMQIMLVDREFEKKEYELALERQQIARLESDLAEKVVQITDQVELFSTLRRDLEGIVKKIPADSPAAFDLKKRLRSLPQGVDWKQVEEHFRGVHPRFQLNLSKEFPGLSQTELRLCTLLRLNLSSRDISRLLSLSIRTIENHRYNIRKKLGLLAEQDIAQYLAKI